MITPVSRQMWRTLLSKGESRRTAGRAPARLWGGCRSWAGKVAGGVIGGGW